MGPRSHARSSLRDRRPGEGRVAECVRVPDPLPGGVRRDRQDAEPAPTRARSLGGGADGRHRWPFRGVVACLGPGGRARAARRRAPRGPAKKRVPAARHAGALGGDRLPRDGRTPRPDLRPRPGRPLSHRHRGRGRTDAPHGGLARGPRDAIADRGAPPFVSARPGWGPSDDRGHAYRPLQVERGNGRRVPASRPAGTTGTTPFSRHWVSPRT